MANASASMIKTFQQQRYLLFSTPPLDPVVPSTHDMVSHDEGVVIGPEGEKVPFKELLNFGAKIEDRYHEGAVALLGKVVAHRTQGRFPERWVGVSTGLREVDVETIQKTASYALSTFGHLIDPEDREFLTLDSKGSMHDLFMASLKLANCLEEIAETEDRPQLASWVHNAHSVVENFMRGVHVARVNLPLRHDNGSMLALFKEMSFGSGAYIGTRHGIPFTGIRKSLELGMPVEGNLNFVGAFPGTWVRVHQGQPFKATPGVLAELVMRDGQQSAKLLGGNMDMALTKEAVVGAGKLKKQILGPSGPVADCYRTWKMRAGKLWVRGVEFVSSGATPYVHKEKDKYRHVRVTEGAVKLLIGDQTEILEDGNSALVLPGAGFMVGVIPDTIPSSYVVSTLTNL